MQYVQGGGCTSVGVVGWHIGGGYGSFSKKFGTGPANLLEARVVTANGDVVVASEYQNEDLFFALRGGGHGFGVVVSLTVRTHPLPKLFGAVEGFIRSRDEETGKALLTTFLEFYKASLSGPNWGEIAGIYPDGEGYRINLVLLSCDLTEEEMMMTLQPMSEWVAERPEDYTVEVSVKSIPAKSFWDINYEVQVMDNAIPSPYDPTEPERAFFWKGNKAEISRYWMTYVSRFLRVDHFLDDTKLGMQKLMDLVKGTGGVDLHINKAQYGASEWAVQELEKTPMHPSIKDSFGLLIAARGVDHYSPLVAKHLQYNTSNIRYWMERCNTEYLENCSEVLTPFNNAVHKFREDTPGAGSYFNEADFFEEHWQDNFWGVDNYMRLLDIKFKWDPNQLFYCHKCVGSEFLEEGGMCHHPKV